MAEPSLTSRNRSIKMADSDNISPSRRIRVPKTSELVADQIRGQIVRGELQEEIISLPKGSC